MIFEILDTSTNQYVDMIPYVAYGGLRYTRNDVDGENAGRVLKDGNMVRDRLAIKDKWEVTCIPLDTADCARVFQLIEPEFITVRITSPRTGIAETKQFYSNNVPASYLINKGDVEYWGGIAFPMVEQ